MKEKTVNKIKTYCMDNNVDIINIRSVKNSGKTRIILTCHCSKCDKRYDVRWETVKRQKYKGLCTSCAHKESAKYKVLTVQQIVKRFEDYGFKVVTPIEKIKPRGKRNVYFTPVEIMNKYGDIYTTNCNNFCMRIDYYKELSNCDKRNMMLANESRLEYKVRKFLDEQNIPYKQQFRFMDCRGKKYPLPFDFCLYYTDEDNRMLIEVDGDQHFREDSIWADTFETIKKHDRTKTYYCNSHHIPLLRLRTNDIDNKNEKYKDMILDFIHTNR